MAVFSFPVVYEWLRYDRVLFLQGEYWRVVTGQWIHITVMHALLNISVGLILYVLSRQLHIEAKFWQSLWVAVCGVAVALVLFLPDVSWYVGMSGFLHGVVIVVLVVFTQQYRMLGGLILLGFAAKLWYEFYYGAVSDMGFNVVTEVHLAGAVSGFLLVIYDKTKAKLRL